MLKLFNSFSRNKQDFVPFGNEIIKIFICGPTVYDYTHLGHARIFLVYDLLARLLHDKGYRTDVLVNLTDINQNVFAKAKESSSTYKDVAKFYASAFMDDIWGLNISSVSRFAFVSDYISSIEKQVAELVSNKTAYISHGNVYLDTSKVKNYGKISGQSREQLSLHRLDIGPGKKSQEDIMLWNCTGDFEFFWPSQFGKGIPWWHMQDTAVAMENFGKSYDIHGGARELVYPHHEAHLAQYQLLSGLEMPVKTWMHVGLVLKEGQKMSKSLGNVVWIKDLINKYGQNLIRLYIFSKHYRNDFDFSEDDMMTQKPLLDLIRLVQFKVSDITEQDIANLIIEFVNSLDDDLDSPQALKVLEKICLEVIGGKKINKTDFSRLCNILGVVS